MNKSNTNACAPLKGWVIALALAAILLLASAVCLLHWHNAVSLRGGAKVSEYTIGAAAEEGLVLIMHDPDAKDGVLHISGALLRPGREVSGVKLRAALLSGNSDTAILLNTQMVRRQDYAAQYGADDHCGFYAAAEIKRLPDGEYRIMLADEMDGTKRLFESGVTVKLNDGSAAFAWAEEPESEAQHD